MPKMKKQESISSLMKRSGHRKEDYLDMDGKYYSKRGSFIAIEKDHFQHDFDSDEHGNNTVAGHVKNLEKHLNDFGMLRPRANKGE